MSATLTISDELATALEARRKQTGMPSLNATAEALLERAISLDATDADSLGLSDGELRSMIAEGESSGPTVAWDAAAVRAEVRRRYMAKKAR